MGALRAMVPLVNAHCRPQMSWRFEESPRRALGPVTLDWVSGAGRVRDHGGFRLQPNEDFLFGVRMSGNELRFGPSGGALLWSALTAPLAVGIAAFVLFADIDSTTLIFWDVSAATWRLVVVPWLAAIVWLCVARAGSAVRANESGVSIRSTWRSRSFAWNEIEEVRVVESRPVRNFRLVLGESGGGYRADIDSSQAYLVCRGGSLVRLPGFEASAKASGMSGDLATPTEIKVGALRRYRDTVDSP